MKTFLLQAYATLFQALEFEPLCTASVFPLPMRDNDEKPIAEELKGRMIVL